MQSDEQQIRQLVETWMEATRQGDIDTILGLVADDVVFLIAGQPPMTGKRAFADAMNAQPTGAAPQIEGHSEIQDIEIHGDCATMWTKLRVSVRPPGESEPMVRAGHTLTMLRKESGRWVIARDANLLVPVTD